MAQPRVIWFDVIKFYPMADDDIEAWRDQYLEETLPEDFAGNIWYPMDAEIQYILISHFAKEQPSPDIEIFYDSTHQALITGKPRESDVQELRQHLTIDLFFEMIRNRYADYQQLWSMGKVEGLPVYFLVTR